uniref:Wzz/FepE/Etk N-terminal domain-containing protein n=1 Tax=uncultured Dysgonomonas sp. TaxID=206096 RepID=UPI0026286D95|nr:Wzz/FepE/Etk N-terminal domain-containing protein [uncultured Dysgonomonas sp.]
MDTNIDKEISSDKEIDLIDLGKKLWQERKFILKISLVGLAVGIIVAFSIPKEYTTTVILAPEANSGNTTSSAGALAAMAGINLGPGGGNNPLVSPALYPTIMESTPFIKGLFDIKIIVDSSKNTHQTLYSYITASQKSSWWSSIRVLPSKLMKVFSTKDSQENKNSAHNFIISREESTVIDNLRDRLNITVDKKTGVLILEVIMQNPEVSTIVADTLTSYLQAYIISYRTQKAREDLSFTEKLYVEAKKDYAESQQKYAKFLDENQNIILASYRVNQEKLQNEMTLAYGVYNQMAQQLQLAKVKVQDTTPVYTIIEPPIVPLIPTKPNKKLIVAGCLILSIVGSLGWIIGRDFFLRSSAK